MDPSNIRRGDWIAAISGAALAFFMFLDWFGFDSDPARATETAEQLGIPPVSVEAFHYTAWEGLAFIDVFLALTAATGVVLPMAVASTGTVLPLRPAVIATVLGIAATALVLFRIVDPPGETDREFGAFLGFAAAMGIACGGWMSLREQGIVSDVHTQKLA